MTGSVEGGGGISTKGELISGQDHHVGNGDGDDHEFSSLAMVMTYGDEDEKARQMT